MNKFGPKAQETVEKAMRKYKRGELRSGSSGKKVTTVTRRLPLDSVRPARKATRHPRNSRYTRLTIITQHL